ncbi:MAG: DnaD domain protein [Chloroflexi bacterium]|nr:DnaD domain protein [Chloroflexota bacterium]
MVSGGVPAGGFSAVGFPAGISFTPVPSPLLGELLAEMRDATELRVILRLIWLASQKKGVPRTVSASELAADRVIASALELHGEALEAAVSRSLLAAVGRGTLLKFPYADGSELFCLNTEPERRAVARLALSTHSGREPLAASSEAPQMNTERPNIFVLYEQNIGPLTPIVGQLLKDAQLSFPAEWIEEAIEIAVQKNARNWKYVSAILERWAGEGRPREQSRRDLQADRLEPYRRAYGRYLKPT